MAQIQITVDFDDPSAQLKIHLLAGAGATDRESELAETIQELLLAALTTSADDSGVKLRFKQILP